MGRDDGISHDAGPIQEPLAEVDKDSAKTMAADIYQSLESSLADLKPELTNRLDTSMYPEYLISRAASFEFAERKEEALKVYEELLQFYETGPILTDTTKMNIDFSHAHEAAEGMVRAGGDPSSF